ncbi:hypothetical protein EVAR_7019_1 [Eumeta japonica]|uniref:Uncharacterized protein n=1 Tax=Eumeta variegata TaxID=151549 RepID=A0A4C1THL1_EUMVA|nr:hypothetical protein EVAR_7019_1 [Eumeta japonica]
MYLENFPRVQRPRDKVEHGIAYSAARSPTHAGRAYFADTSSGFAIIYAMLYENLYSAPGDRFQRLANANSKRKRNSNNSQEPAPSTPSPGSKLDFLRVAAARGRHRVTAHITVII